MKLNKSKDHKTKKNFHTEYKILTYFIQSYIYIIWVQNLYQDTNLSLDVTEVIVTLLHLIHDSCVQNLVIASQCPIPTADSQIYTVPPHPGSSASPLYTNIRNANFVLQFSIHHNNPGY